VPDFYDLALAAFLETGAVRFCANHSDVLLSAEDYDDPVPQEKGYDLFVARAKAQGFEGSEDLRLQPTAIYVLQSADDFCMKCRQEGSA